MLFITPQLKVFELKGKKPLAENLNINILILLKILYQINSKEKWGVYKGWWKRIDTEGVKR